MKTYKYLKAIKKNSQNNDGHPDGTELLIFAEKIFSEEVKKEAIKAGAEMANYPFATIEPNVGMVEVPDNRLARIQEVVPADKIIPTTFEFTDIAGIVKGASQGEGLGNKFLENIRQVNAIVHVVRAFDGDEIVWENQRESR